MMTQQVKSHDTKPEKLSLIPGTHMVEEPTPDFHTCIAAHTRNK